MTAEEILQKACQDAYMAQAIGSDDDLQANIAIGCLWDARHYLKGHFSLPRTHELMGLYTRQHFAETRLPAESELLGELLLGWVTDKAVTQAFETVDLVMGGAL